MRSFRRWWRSCKQLPELRDVATDQEVNGLRASWCSTATPLRAGHHAFDHRQDAVRRLRPAAGLDHVHAAEPVSRGAGSEAGLSHNPVGFERSVHPLGGGGRDQRSAESRRRVDGDGGLRTVQRLGRRGDQSPRRATALAGSSSSASSAVFGGAASPASQVFTNGEPGAAQRVHAHGDRPRFPSR